MHHRRRHTEIVLKTQWFTTADTNESDELDSTTQLGSYQVIKGYLPNQWSITQSKFSRDQGLDSRHNTGERWTSQFIIFLWTQGHILWKDRCTSAHGPAADSLDKSSAHDRQTAQNFMTMAYASSPMLPTIRLFVPATKTAVLISLTRQRQSER
jgi:hypothetical protein